MEAQAKPLLVNGVDLTRVGALLSGKAERSEATGQEIAIAQDIKRRVDRMHQRGYTVKACASHATQLAMAAAMRLGGNSAR